MRKLDWKQDGSDLMEEAEIYYQEAINSHKWGRKSLNQMYIMLLSQLHPRKNRQKWKKQKMNPRSIRMKSKH